MTLLDKLRVSSGLTLKTHYRYNAARLLDSWWDRTTGLLTEPREILRSARKESRIILFGSVALHMIGNLKSLLGDEADGMAAVDAYARFLRTMCEPALLLLCPTPVPRFSQGRFAFRRCQKE